jgi:hypothetical protein
MPLMPLAGEQFEYLLETKMPDVAACLAREGAAPGE